MPTDIESVVDFQQVGNQVVGNQCQLNTKQSNTKKENKDIIKEEEENFFGSCKFVRLFLQFKHMKKLPPACSGHPALFTI